MFNSKVQKDAEGSVSMSNIIGKGSNVEGSIATTGNLRIEGKITGKVHAKAKVVLSHTSQVEGDILAQNAEIGGQVQGTIEVSELLVFKSTAIVKGDIVATKLVFEEGAYFDGKCKMGKASNPAHMQQEANQAKTEEPPSKKKGDHRHLKLGHTH